MAEVQYHGIEFEDIIIKSITGFSKIDYDRFKVGGHTSSMDIIKDLHSDKNYSIKSSSGPLYLSDVNRFMNHCKNDDFTIILGIWSQLNDIKRYNMIYEIDITPNLWNFLWGNIIQEDIMQFIRYVKEIPAGKQGQLDHRNLWKELRTSIYSKGKGLVNIDAKIDSKTQRRVQCSIRFNELISNSDVKYREYTDKYRGIELPYDQKSNQRSKSKRP